MNYFDNLHLSVTKAKRKSMLSRQSIFLHKMIYRGSITIPTAGHQFDCGLDSVAFLRQITIIYFLG